MVRMSRRFMSLDNNPSGRCLNTAPCLHLAKLHARIESEAQYGIQMSHFGWMDAGMQGAYFDLVSVMFLESDRVKLK